MLVNGVKTQLKIGAIACCSAILAAPAPASAFSITQNHSIDLLHQLLGDTTGLSNFQVSATNQSQAFGLFSNDPFGLGSGIVLSTGNVTHLPGQNTIDGGTIADYTNVPNDLSTDFGDSGSAGDAVKLNISFDAGSTVEKLFFNYVFGSEEFVEFGGSVFNDSFSLLLNGQNLAKLSDGKTVSINNLIPNPSNSSSYHADYINNPAGSGVNTKLDGFTKMLAFEGLLLQNARNVLTIEISDFGDGRLDSAVFIQGGTLGTIDPNAPPPDPVIDPIITPSPVPEPGMAIALLSVGTVGGSVCALRRFSAKS